MNQQDMYEQGLRMMAAAKEQAAVEQVRSEAADTSAQQQATETQKEPAQKEPELMLCPCCNKRTLVRPIEAKGSYWITTWPVFCPENLSGESTLYITATCL